MSNRKIIVYIACGCIFAILLTALYFFVHKPKKPPVPIIEDSRTAIVFKDVKYSGERRGIVDWEMTAKTARKYIDQPLIELEDLTGLYKPESGIVIEFRGTKGFMDTDKEAGSVENVEVLYKGEYTLKSPSMNFDFKNGITTTQAPVEVVGTRLTMQGVGLLAVTAQESVKLLRNVSGFITTEKSVYRFQSDTLTYLFRESTYILTGKVIMRGTDMDLACDELRIFTEDDDVERIEARGRVRVISKGTVAKSEKAVYHFKEGRIVFTESPKVFKDNVEMKGEEVIYTTKDGKLSVEKPKIRMEQGKQER